MRANSPVEFTQDYLFPRPRARYTVSFGIDDVLLTAASDSEDFGPSLADALQLSGQEARPSPAYSELVDMLSRIPEKLSHGLDDEPRESRSSKLDERFLSGVNSKMSGGSCRFSVICIRFPDPGNSLFLPTLLTLTSPTSWCTEPGGRFSPWGDIGWSPPLCVGSDALGRFAPRQFLLVPSVP